MHLYFATQEAEERRIALLSRAEQAREQAALREIQPSRFVRVPTILERLVAKLQHGVRRTMLAVQPR